MTKTIEQIAEIVDRMTGQSIVYKVECDEVKNDLSRAYDDARRDIGKEFTYGGKWQALSPTERALDDAIPYELRHMYGKTFEKVFTATDEGAFKDAVQTVRNRFRPLYNALQALIERQVKARRPVEKTRTVIGTRIQLRSQCPHCMAEQAVTPRGMAEHGFQLKWDQRMGSCPGTNKPHYGTVEGRKIQEALVDFYEGRMNVLRNAIRDTKAGINKPRDKKTHQPIENPTPSQVQNLVSAYESELYNARSAIGFYKRHVSSWAIRMPREVEVEIYAA